MLIWRCGSAILPACTNSSGPLCGRSMSGRLVTGCSCPDWSNPCKHIAAVYYLVGEEFDHDPFLIFKLRGVERDKLTALLGAKASTRSTRPKGTASTARDPTTIEEPIDSSAATFWEGSELPPGWLGELRNRRVATDRFGLLLETTLQMAPTTSPIFACKGISGRAEGEPEHGCRGGRRRLPAIPVGNSILATDSRDPKAHQKLAY